MTRQVAALPLLALALPFALASGCAHTQGDKVHDARLAQIEEQNQAQLDAVDKRTEAQDRAVDQSHEQTESALARSSEKDADAQEQLADVDKDRTKYSTDARAALEKLSLRIDAAKKKIAVLGTKVPTSVRGELQSAETEKQTLQKNIETLPGTAPSDWDGKRNMIDKRLEELDNRVDKLSDAVEGAA